MIIEDVLDELSLKWNQLNYSAYILAYHAIIQLVFFFSDTSPDTFSIPIIKYHLPFMPESYKFIKIVSKN